MTPPSLRERLVRQLARFDEAAFVALANRGLLRRAQKDFETRPATIVEEDVANLTMACGEHRVCFDASGPAHARCSCPASGVCQHILIAALSLQRLAGAGTPPAPAAPTAATPPATARSAGKGTDACAAHDPELSTASATAELQEELLAVPFSELVRHAGKAGYRWAWQYVGDLAPEHGLSIGGERNLVLSLGRPRLVFRYVGGGLDGLLADVELKQAAKYRVAAVLALARAHGRPLAAPEPTAAARNEALDFGRDHAGVAGAAQHESRQRLRESAAQLFAECVELGLAHLSQGIHERYATLAVWAQGAEYPRLAMLLRRLADHVEMLLERAGAADEHRLLDELALAQALVDALAGAAVRGQAPPRLIGRARSRYEAGATLELLGLGASAWRSQSGYVGLTMVLWAPAEQAFFTCSDARPEGQRGFDPLARYKAAGPWGGLGAPAQATGRRVTLTQPMLNEAGRLSASDETTATVAPAADSAALACSLPGCDAWPPLLQARATARASLLAEPRPAEDWAVLRPARFGPAEFDEQRQALVWPLFDGDGERLDAELAYGPYTAHAIARIEALREADLPSGTALVARLRAGGRGIVAEPLSLVRPQPKAGDALVDALHFDGTEPRSPVMTLLDKVQRRVIAASGASNASFVTDPLPQVLLDFRRWLQRQAERGLAEELAEQAGRERARWVDKAAMIGFTAFASVATGGLRPGAVLLRCHYVGMQYERLLGGWVEDEE